MKFVEKMNGKVIFEAPGEIPEEIAREAFKNVKARGLQPDTEPFREEFLDEVERLVCE